MARVRSMLLLLVVTMAAWELAIGSDREMDKALSMARANSDVPSLNAVLGGVRAARDSDAPSSGPYMPRSVTPVPTPSPPTTTIRPVTRSPDPSSRSMPQISEATTRPVLTVRTVGADAPSPTAKLSLSTIAKPPFATITSVTSSPTTSPPTPTPPTKKIRPATGAPVPRSPVPKPSPSTMVASITWSPDPPTSLVRKPTASPNHHELAAKTATDLASNTTATRITGRARPVTLRVPESPLGRAGKPHHDDASARSSPPPLKMPKDPTTNIPDNGVRVTVSNDVLIIQNGTEKQRLELYKRHKPHKPPPTTPPPPIATDLEDDEESEAFDHGINVIVGGRNRTLVVPGTAMRVSPLAQKAHQLVQLTCTGLAVTTVALLTLFHMLALRSPPWLPSRRRRSDGDAVHSCLSPNVWELLLVVGYFQHLGSLSMMDLTLAPEFVLDFTDAFSWTNFNAQAMGSGPARRLTYTILTGMVAYADRLGIDEAKLLAYTTRCFFIVVGVIVGGFFLVILWQCCTTRRPFGGHSSSQSGALCVLGLVSGFWILILLPLSAASSYEMRMQLTYSINGDVLIILFNLVFVAFGGLSLFIRRIQAIRLEDAMDDHYVAAFGTLYADMKQNARFFFAVLSLFQLALGISIGVIVDGANQLITQLLLHSVVIVAMILMRPYFNAIVNVFVGAVTMLRMVNLMQATLYVTSTTSSMDNRSKCAHLLVFANFSVMVLIFFRQALVLIYVLRMWSDNLALEARHAAVEVAGNSEMRTISLRFSFTNSSDPKPSYCARSTLREITRSDGDVESPVPNLAHRPLQEVRDDDVTYNV